MFSNGLSRLMSPDKTKIPEKNIYAQIYSKLMKNDQSGRIKHETNAYEIYQKERENMLKK